MTFHVARAVLFYCTERFPRLNLLCIGCVYFPSKSAMQLGVAETSEVRLVFVRIFLK